MTYDSRHSAFEGEVISEVGSFKEEGLVTPEGWDWEKGRLKICWSIQDLVKKILISPWGQSWERVFHKHLCIQFIALVPAIGGIEPLSLEWNARMLTTTLSIHSFKTRVDYNKLSYEIKGPISPTLHKPKLGWSILGIKAYLLLQTLLTIQFSACPSGISWRIIGI